MRFLVVAIAFALSNGFQVPGQSLQGKLYTIGDNISQCVKPPKILTHCSFPADYTVPISIASRINSINEQIKTIKKMFSAADSDGCADAFVRVLCDYLVQPKCVGNETVQFKSNFKDVRTKNPQIEAYI